MSNLSNQQINSSFNGLLQIPGGITSSLKQVQDGNGNGTGLYLSSTGGNVTTSSTFVASINNVAIPNAVSRLISDGFGDYVSVKDFGAKGDGVTDDTSAINAAFTAVGGGTVFIPAGIYKISAPIVTYGSWFGAGRDTVIKPTGDFHAFEIQSAHIDGGDLGSAGNYMVDYQSAGTLTIAGVAHWFNKGATVAATSSTAGFRMHDIFVYKSYHALYQSASDIALFWNVSFENIVILNSVNYGIYLNLSGTSGSLQVDFRNVVIDGGSSPTAKGAYLRAITKLNFDGIATGLGSGVTGGVMQLTDCSQVTLKLQCEYFTISNASSLPLAFFNVANAELDLLFTTISIDVGAGNFCNLCYLDSASNVYIFKRFTVQAPNLISGSFYKIQVIGTGANLKILDKTITASDCNASAQVINNTQFIDVNVTASGIKSNGWLKNINNGIFESTLQVSVSTSASIIYNWANNNDASTESQPALLMVGGTDSASITSNFVDLVLVVSSTNNSNPKILTVVSSNSAGGAAARTYTQDSSGNLLCAMASGNYYIRSTAIHGYAPFR